MNGFAACPQCSTRMVIHHMSCWSCGTEVRGRLGVPMLARLPEELSRFVLLFLQANGSLSQVQKEVGCSYPKVRRLLNEVMAFLREEVESDLRQKDDILLALEEERMEGSEALKLIRALGGAGPSERVSEASDESPSKATS